MIEKILQKEQLNRDDIVSLLELADFSPVYQAADRVRAEYVGDVVHLRAIIEFSNVCKRQCKYCGLNRENKSLPRFRMRHEEILETAAQAVKAGYRTIVLQSGEDDYFTAKRLGEIISAIKKLPNPPAVTISCGERSRADFAYFKAKGADRYLLKHETADAALYDRLHPCGTLRERVDCLKTICGLGYETGSGFMVGLPGQTLETIAADLLLLKEIPCRMAGIGPFIANPKTLLAGERNGDPELTRRAVAIARLLLPKANLPLTTALSVLSQEDENRSRKASERIRAEGPGNVNESRASRPVGQGSGKKSARLEGNRKGKSIQGSAAGQQAGEAGNESEAKTSGRQTDVSKAKWADASRRESAGKLANCDCMKKAGLRLGEDCTPITDDGGNGAPMENPFSFGANVVMKKVTPDQYKAAYEIYPAEFKKTDIFADRQELEQLIKRFHRIPE